jgi:hypothetical protein
MQANSGELLGDLLKRLLLEMPSSLLKSRADTVVLSIKWFSIYRDHKLDSIITFSIVLNMTDLLLEIGVNV